jgi:glycosyltransferase involved in cell wall biosynthesis
MPLPFYRQVKLGVATPRHAARLLGRLRPDLVHIATEGPLGLSALLGARVLGIPVASSFHTNFDHYADHYGVPGIRWMVTHYLAFFHNRTAVTLVPSEATRRRLEKIGVRDVAIWSRGVDCDTFHPRHRDDALRHSLGLGPEDVLLLYVGRLAPEKNLSALLDAFSRLMSRSDSVPVASKRRLALVGDGPQFDELRRTAPPDVLLPGQQLGADLSRWYASADIFAFPSCSETFGNVVLEAQASGLPVVGFDTQGVNERVISGRDGFLVPEGGDLTLPLARLCDNREERRQFGIAGRARAEQQSWAAIFDELERRYVELAPAGGENPPSVVGV